MIKRSTDWSKRNDHRHHAMDALVIAFTSRGIGQYLNNVNAESNKTKSIYGIEQKRVKRDDRGKMRFVSPIALPEFRFISRMKLEEVLVSIKAKNKVVTSNVNVSKKHDGVNRKVQLTPRGQLHNETIYGSVQQYVTKEGKIGAGFTAEKIA